MLVCKRRDKARSAKAGGTRDKNYTLVRFTKEHGCSGQTVRMLLSYCLHLYTYVRLYTRHTEVGAPYDVSCEVPLSFSSSAVLQKCLRAYVCAGVVRFPPREIRAAAIEIAQGAFKP